MINIAYGFTCPETVDKTNWIDGGSFSERFSISQDGHRIIVTRTDSDEGWGMNLKFSCCNNKGEKYYRFTQVSITCSKDYMSS